MDSNYTHQSTFHSITLPIQSIFINNKSDYVVLMLHGYFDSATSFLNRTFFNLNTPFSILAPNAPFPVLHLNKNKDQEGYSWYFYNTHSKKMILPPDYSLKIIEDLIKKYSLDEKKIIIVGFSQGGYLAPLVCSRLNSVVGVITVGAGYREDFWKGVKKLAVTAIHGGSDQIVPYVEAKEAFEKIIVSRRSGKWICVPGLGHSLNDQARDILYQEILTIIAGGEFNVRGV